MQSNGRKALQKSKPEQSNGRKERTESKMNRNNLRKKKHNGMKQTTKKNPTELKKTAESTGKENKEK